MSRIATPLAFLIAFLIVPTAWGQVGNLGGGNNGGNTDAGANNRATDTTGGATTSSTQSATTSGDLSSEADGAEAGANRATSFIGSGGTNGFVGGGAESDFVSNRRFQGVQQEQINKSTTSQSSGSPRRIPVSFRVGFKVNRNPGSSLLIRKGTQTPLQRVAVGRPELRGINVAVDAKGVATLSGRAPDTAAVRLAANMVRLRAGVRQVRSLVQVAAADSQ